MDISAFSGGGAGLEADTPRPAPLADWRTSALSPSCLPVKCKGLNETVVEACLAPCLLKSRLCRFLCPVSPLPTTPQPVLPLPGDSQPCLFTPASMHTNQLIVGSHVTGLNCTHHCFCTPLPIRWEFPGSRSHVSLIWVF